MIRRETKGVWGIGYTHEIEPKVQPPEGEEHPWLSIIRVNNYQTAQHQQGEWYVMLNHTDSHRHKGKIPKDTPVQSIHCRTRPGEAPFETLTRGQHREQIEPGDDWNPVSYFILSVELMKEWRAAILLTAHGPGKAELREQVS